MPRRNFLIPDELDARFRKAVRRRDGDDFGYGSYGHALQEALQDWIQKQESKPSKRQ